MDSSASETRASHPQNTDHFQLLVDAVTEYAIYTLDLEGRVASWNIGAARIKGYESAEILGRPFRIFFPEEARAAGLPEALLAEAREKGIAKNQGWRLRKDGTRFIADATISPIYDKAGVLRGYAKVTRDTTDRKTMEALKDLNNNLTESENRLRASAEELEGARRRLDIILNGVDNAIIAQDNTGKIVFANAAAARYLGYPSAEILLRAPLSEILARYRILNEDGTPFPLDRMPGLLALTGVNGEAVIMRYQ